MSKNSFESMCGFAVVPSLQSGAGGVTAQCGFDGQHKGDTCRSEDVEDVEDTKDNVMILHTHAMLARCQALCCIDDGRLCGDGLSCGSCPVHRFGRSLCDP